MREKYIEAYEICFLNQFNNCSNDALIWAQSSLINRVDDGFDFDAAAELQVIAAAEKDFYEHLQAIKQHFLHLLGRAVHNQKMTVIEAIEWEAA